MPAHAKEIDSREKYGLWLVWFLVTMASLVALLFAFVVGILSTVWAGLLVGVLAILTTVRLVTYTRGLLRYP